MNIEVSDGLLNLKRLKKGAVIYITALCDKYRNLLYDQGVETAMAYRSSHLKRKLESFYGGTVMTEPQTGTSSLICSSKLTIASLFQEVKKMKTKTEEYVYPHIQGLISSLKKQ